MAAIETPHDAETSSGRIGPGLLLRKARESAQIGVHDVAAQLHLDVRTIASLERDAFDELPAPTFVRGYLRGYARLLSVPVGPVMEAYDREGFHHPDLVADIAEKPQARSGDLPVRLLTYVIVVVLAALVVWWWYDRESGDASTDFGIAGITLPEFSTSSGNEAGSDGSPASAASPDPATGAARDTAGAAGSAAAAPETPLDINKRVEAELAQVERSLGQSAPDGAAPAPLTGGGTGAARAEPAATASPSAAVAPPAAHSPASTAAVTAPAAPAAAAEASLRLEFPIEAWVEVYDRDGAKLYFNLVKPGRVLELSGKPPMRVLLGRSRGVTLQYNGEAVDLAPHVRKGGVAQLTLGE